MAKKKVSKRKVTTSSLFPRHRRLPTRVQASSELWLEIFLHNIDTLLGVRDFNGFSQIDEVQIISTAESLADRALDRFQFRWPNAEL